jgi:hypothetical protein
VTVLRQQRLVQPKRMPQLHKFAGRRAFPKHLLDRIARHDVDHQKYQRQNQPKRRQSKQKSLQEMPRHH